MIYNINQQWFLVQYGREEESYSVLFRHPTPHSRVKFLSHFHDAIVLFLFFLNI